MRCRGRSRDRDSHCFSSGLPCGAAGVSQPDQAADLLGLDWDAVQRIMDRAVQRGLKRRELDGLAHVGIDEKSFRSGQSYIALLSDLDGSRVLEVVEGCDQKTAEALWLSLPEEHSGAALWRWRWTWRRRSSPRAGWRCRRPIWCMTSSTSPSISTKPWIRCVAKNTKTSWPSSLLKNLPMF